MTTFNAATDLPPGINTAERGALWFLLLLYFMHGKEDYSELQGEQTPLITFQQGMAADGTERAIFRVSIEIEPDFAISNEKLFFLAKEFSSGANIPSAFKTAN